MTSPRDQRLSETVDWVRSEGLQAADERSRPRQHYGPGTLLAGRYHIFDRRCGGMGEVLLADDEKAREEGTLLRVAIKSVPDYDDWCRNRRARRRSTNKSSYDDLVFRFRREAETWVRIPRHENIIWALWVIDVGAKPYLVLEYADGGDLAEWIAGGKLTLRQAFNFAIQFCEGMIHAQETAGIVHRDIKPQNVLVSGIKRQLKITDLGLAKAIYETDEVADCNEGIATTNDHSALGAGTLPYMAPEQFISLASADTRSDIFSFGAMFFEMVTGRRMFREGLGFDQQSLKNHEAPLAHHENPNVPRTLSDLIHRCVAYAPDDRFQSFLDIRHVLTHIADVTAVEFRDSGVPQTKAGRQNSVPEIPEEVHVVQQTYSLLSLGKAAEAAACARDGIKRSPTNADHWINLSKAYFDLKDYSAAVDAAARASELDPQSALAWANLGTARLAIDDKHKAREAAVKATRADPQHAGGWACRACCEWKLGQQQNAIQFMRQAVELEAHNWEFALELGRYLSEQHQHEAALSALNSVVAINPDSADVWKQLAIAYGSAGQTKEALRAIESAISLTPEDSDLWAIRATTLWLIDGVTPEVIR